MLTAESSSLGVHWAISSRYLHIHCSYAHPITCMFTPIEATYELQFLLLQAAADHHVSSLQLQVEDLKRQLKKRLEEVDELSTSTASMQLVSSNAPLVVYLQATTAYLKGHVQCSQIYAGFSGKIDHLSFVMDPEPSRVLCW